MIKVNHISSFICSFVLLFSIASFKPDKNQQKEFTLLFESYAGDRIVQLDTVSYKNELGQSYSVSKFKYYISNIHLKKADGKEYVSKEFFLVNEDNPESRKLVLKDVQSGDYSSISFVLGVDSLHNCSGLQEGALDPMNGMFWAWNTGYIFLKLEGHSPESKSTANIFEYHIGGYKKPANCIRTITLDLTKRIAESSLKEIHSIKIKTDIDQFFKSPVTIDFSKLSSVTDFNNAEMVADNYTDMFSVLEVK